MELVWLCILFPLLGFGMNAMLGDRLPRRAHGLIATVAVILSFVVALIVLADLLSRGDYARYRDLVLYDWVVVDGFTAALGVWVDPLSTLMVLIVTGVGALIHLYATGYMADEEGQRRFFAYLNLFIVAMLILVLADNFMLLLVGWGGVGFASFALIAHYFQRESAANAAVKAFVINTLGDVGMMFGIFLIWITFGAVDYATVFDQAARDRGAPGALVAITLLLLVGALAKSGQLPLHTWLPDAMAGPTPVSALIHAATMVTAGVYLLARAWPLFERAPVTLTTIAWLGAATALFGATIGLVQTNIKRVLAFSTISQLGYMFLAAGLGAYGAAIFHLFTHAFFKALLFLAAGAVIHLLHGLGPDEAEDLRNMGGLRRRAPLAWAAFGIGGLAIAGIIPFSGFFSKDEIIWSAFTSARGNALLGIVALLTGGLTAFYVFRAFFLAFYDAPRADAQENHQHADEHQDSPGLAMGLPLVVLSLLATVGGWVMIPGLVDAFERFLAPTFTYPVEFDAPTHAAGGASYWLLALVAIGLGVAGIALAYVLYVVQPQVAADLATRFAGIHRLLLHRYYVDEIYDALLVRPTRALSRFLAGSFDRAIDFTGGAVATLVREASVTLRETETGYIRNYALLIVGGVVFILAFVLFGV